MRSLATTSCPALSHRAALIPNQAGGWEQGPRDGGNQGSGRGRGLARTRSLYSESTAFGKPSASTLIGKPCSKPSGHRCRTWSPSAPDGTNAAAYRHLVAVSRRVGPGQASPSEGVPGGRGGWKLVGLGHRQQAMPRRRGAYPGEGQAALASASPEQTRRELGLFGSPLSTVGRFLGGW